MNILDLIGIGIFFGVIGGKIFKGFKIPQVVAYIFLGLFIGRSILHIYQESVVDAMTPIVNFTLGIIGVIIGAELRLDVFKKYGKSIYFILVSEGVFAFLLVCTFVTLVTGELYLGLLLGAIASATDPASTVNVLWEYKAKGVLTTTVTSIVALDDGLALLIYGLASVFAKSLILHECSSFFGTVFEPLFEIAQCLVLGAVCGGCVILAIKWIKEKEHILAFSLSVICLVVGFSLFLKLDLILSSMAMGFVISNVLPEESEKLMAKVREMSTSLYILFFVIVGAQLDIHIFMQTSILILVGVYLLSRSFGKVLGAFIGGLLSKAQPQVTKYTGLCLFTQGGVAMGLALSINRTLSGVSAEASQVGALVMNVIAATTFVVQIIGPLLVKFSISRAGEVNCNITREDIIEGLSVGDIMQKDFSLVQAGTSLKDIIKIVRQKESYNFPVVSSSKQLMGSISLEELKHALLEESIYDMILAGDILTTVKTMICSGDPLKKIIKIFDKYSIEFLPVVDNSVAKKVVGILDRRLLQETVNRLLLARQSGLTA